MKDYDIKIIGTKTNEPTLMVNNYLLHSKYNPVKEAEQIATNHYKSKYLHIVFGYGMGYIVNALKNKIDDQSKIIIVEPLMSQLNEMNIITDNYVVENITRDNINSILGIQLNRFNRKIVVLCSPNYDKLFPKEYKNLLEQVNNSLHVNLIHENTLRYFGETWQKNYLNNLYSAAKDYSLDVIKKQFSCPVVIASGGPSLLKQIPLIKENREKILLVCAGSTINTLVSNGIEPDIVISIDGLDNNFNHFKNLNLKKSNLIYSFTNHFEIRKSFKNSSFFFISNEFENSKKHIDFTLNRNIPIVYGGGSVANYAFSIASYITSGPIALVGQDLAYTDNKTHAENNNNYKIITDDYKKERKMFTTRGYYDDEVLTDYAFYSMKDSFERLTSIVNHESPIYNCTEGGVSIENFEQIPFKNFCDKYAFRRVERNLNLKNNLEKRNDLYNKLIIEVDNYNVIISLLEKALKILEKSNSEFSNKSLIRLAEIDKKNELLFSQVSMSTILSPITVDILRKFEPTENEDKKERFLRIFNQNKELYSRLLEASNLSKKYTLEIIGKILKSKEVDTDV